MRHEIENLIINETTFIINKYYERRRKVRASFANGSVNVRIPSSLSHIEQFKHMNKIKGWIKNKVQKHPEKFKPKPVREYKNGDILKIGEEDYTLKIDFKHKMSSSVKIKDNVFCFSISNTISKEKQNKTISNLLSKSIASKKLDKLKEKIHNLNSKHFNQRINKITFKNNSSKWGSCSMNKNINISTKLLFAPETVLDYVCIHELAHLIELNHSSDFWSLVEKAMPTYKENIKWLKSYGHTLEF